MEQCSPRQPCCKSSVAQRAAPCCPMSSSRKLASARKQHCPLLLRTRNTTFPSSTPQEWSESTSPPPFAKGSAEIEKFEPRFEKQLNVETRSLLCCAAQDQRSKQKVFKCKKAF